MVTAQQQATKDYLLSGGVVGSNVVPVQTPRGIRYVARGSPESKVYPAANVSSKPSKGALTFSDAQTAMGMSESRPSIVANPAGGFSDLVAKQSVNEPTAAIRLRGYNAQRLPVSAGQSFFQRSRQEVVAAGSAPQYVKAVGREMGKGIVNFGYDVMMIPFNAGLAGIASVKRYVFGKRDAETKAQLSWAAPRLASGSVGLASSAYWQVGLPVASYYTVKSGIASVKNPVPQNVAALGLSALSLGFMAVPAFKASAEIAPVLKYGYLSGKSGYRLTWSSKLQKNVRLEGFKGGLKGAVLDLKEFRNRPTEFDAGSFMTATEIENAKPKPALSGFFRSNPAKNPLGELPNLKGLGNPFGDLNRGNVFRALSKSKSRQLLVMEDVSYVQTKPVLDLDAMFRSARQQKLKPFLLPSLSSLKQVQVVGLKSMQGQAQSLVLKNSLKLQLQQESSLRSALRLRPILGLRSGQRSAQELRLAPVVMLGLKQKSSLKQKLVQVPKTKLDENLLPGMPNFGMELLSFKQSRAAHISTGFKFRYAPSISAAALNIVGKPLKGISLRSGLLLRPIAL